MKLRKIPQRYIIVCGTHHVEVREIATHKVVAERKTWSKAYSAWLKLERDHRMFVTRTGRHP